jgi:type III polyketide synthase
MAVSILGLASAIPELEAPASRFDEFARKWAKPSVGWVSLLLLSLSSNADKRSLEKTLFVNHHTKIAFRQSSQNEDSQMLTRADPPPIEEICDAFLELGGALALKASKSAIADWGRSASEITHLICTTCTGSSHPGYDLHLHEQLGLDSSTERTLLHGIGCAGGLSIVRLARNICLAAEAQGRKARVLAVAVEIPSSMIRTELQSLDEEAKRGGRKPNIASVIFSDAASAMIIGSNALEGDGELGPS